VSIVLGLLLRQLGTSQLLSQYEIIVVDEVCVCVYVQAVFIDAQ